MDHIMWAVFYLKITTSADLADQLNGIGHPTHSNNPKKEEKKWTRQMVANMLRRIGFDPREKLEAFERPSPYEERPLDPVVTARYRQMLVMQGRLWDLVPKNGRWMPAAEWPPARTDKVRLLRPCHGFDAGRIGDVDGSPRPGRLKLRFNDLLADGNGTQFPPEGATFAAVDLEVFKRNRTKEQIREESDAIAERIFPGGIGRYRQIRRRSERR